MAVSTNPEIAVLQVEVKTINDTVQRIEHKLDNHSNSYVLRTDFDNFKKQYWLSHTLTAIIVAIIVAVVEYVILSSLQGHK